MRKKLHYYIPAGTPIYLVPLESARILHKSDYKHFTSTRAVMYSPKERMRKIYSSDWYFYFKLPPALSPVYEHFSVEKKYVRKVYK